MNSGPLLFFGIFLTLASSFWGLLLIPQVQLGNQLVTEIQETGALYPVGHSGVAGQGADVYRSLGCVECHTRQVRPRNLGGDIARGWGHRRSVAQDYIRDYPVLLGSVRIGPDLANIGLRRTNATEILKLLYKPAAMQMGGMPAYRFLFEQRHLKSGQQPAADALQVEGEPADLEIIPSGRAYALAEYLLSLRADVSLFEAPLPQKPKPAGEDTNAPASTMTNSQPVPPAQTPAAAPSTPSAAPAK
jgi:cytochrome c oxidase cbb3-type subunit 2